MQNLKAGYDFYTVFVSWEEVSGNGDGSIHRTSIVVEAESKDEALKRAKDNWDKVASRYFGWFNYKVEKVEFQSKSQLELTFSINPPEELHEQLFAAVKVVGSRCEIVHLFKRKDEASKYCDMANGIRDFRADTDLDELLQDLFADEPEAWYLVKPATRKTKIVF